jgi:subtilase family serine protease
MSEQAIRSRRGQRLAAGMAATSLMGLGLLVAPATAADAASRPELSPTPIKVSQTVKAGQRIHFDSGVQNYGGTRSGVFNVKWLVDGEEVGAYGSHSSVPAGSSKLNGNSQFDWTFDDPGSFHTITFIVDADNHVAESNENNNRISRSVHVG